MSASPRTEKNFTYGRILARKIAAEGPGSYDPSDKLDLTHINISRGGTSAIDLDPSQTEETSFADGTGGLTLDEKMLLSEVVAEVNERFGKDLTDVHKVMGASIVEVVSDDPTIQEQAAADQSDDAFALGAFDDVYMDAILQVFEQNTDFGKELLNNVELSNVMRRWILPLARRKAIDKHQRPPAAARVASTAAHCGLFRTAGSCCCYVSSPSGRWMGPKRVTVRNVTRARRGVASVRMPPCNFAMSSGCNSTTATTTVPAAPGCGEWTPRPALAPSEP